MSALDRLADLVGIEPFYHDIWGNRRETSQATKRALITAMGLPAAPANTVADALKAIAKDADPAHPPVVLICGSLYIAGKVLEESGLIPT